ncbi:hypothetical protein IVB46_00810 [Bradyrhizobium sp. 61]|uniref:hypothetical protein n=1 Tax=unclassified Bradyrhizobium TaxID=2631580 RepID=UPI001FFA3CAA|nr:MULTISPECIES: hypothetical protein [unclassified Bradyrhizobium]MCK1273784.1 hypothetical protein [Bradyrhizobium sp. 61]MCK1448720.1 hypothetical protein [Bradyrhizobium sp. 48]
MTDDAAISLEALKREEARLRERLAKIEQVKSLLSELSLDQPIAVSPDRTENKAASASEPPPPPSASEPPAAPSVLVPAFDGTFRGLVSIYREDQRSNYHQLKQKVRDNYDSGFKRLIEDVGSERVAEWSADRVKAIYDESWAAGGKLAMGRSMVAKVRLLCSYGSTVLNDDACTRLGAILSNMRIPVAKSNNESMSREQARAIRITAREHFGWDSIALAQAFQFEIKKLRQVDVIGAWVPLNEGPDSEVQEDGRKWVHGLRWSDLDENLILRKTLTSGRSKDQKTIEYSLNRFQMIREEINRVPEHRRKGPMVICEFNNQPWSTNEFRRKWRMVADKAGVPKTVKNMDSRQDEKAADDPEVGST